MALRTEEYEQIGRDLADTTLNEVVVDGLVLMKIVKHCKDRLPEPAIGQLVGVDKGPVLEVTNCFALPPATGDEESDLGFHQFSLDMLRSFREVHLDCNTVGWYSTAYAESLFMDADSIAAQFDWQTLRGPKSVMLVFDPLRTTQESSLAIRAYRLKQSFLALYKASTTFTVENLQQAGVSFRDIMEEVPIKVRNPAIVHAYLHELDGTPALQPDRARFDLSIYSFLEKNLEFMVDCMDHLKVEHGKFQSYQRAVTRQKKREEKEEDTNAKVPQQPRQLETLLLSSQIASFCDQINRSASQSITKLFLLGGGLARKDEASAAASSSSSGVTP
jgi:translation initiation factor 3 subunit H